MTGGSVAIGDDVALAWLVNCMRSIHGDAQFASKPVRHRWPVAEPVPRRGGALPYPLLLVKHLSGLAGRRGEQVVHYGERGRARPLALRIHPRALAAVRPRPTLAANGRTAISSNSETVIIAISNPVAHPALAARLTAR